MRKTYVKQKKAWGNNRGGKSGIISLVSAVVLALAAPAFAADEDRVKAKRIHDRLAGVPPTEAVLDAMETEIANDPVNAGPIKAAKIAMQNPAFYNVTLKNFATPWTNEEQDVFAPLNDYTATVIGMIRDRETPDGVPFTDLLSGDILYVGDDTISGVDPYSASNNDHYEDLEEQGVDLSNPSNLFKVTQSSKNGIPSFATAGVMTSRAASEAFFIAGTNRAMFRFTLLNHLCNDLEQVKDITRTSDRIRQDVSRSPGGDSRIFLNSCIGCHSGMDPLAQAYAYYNYDETSSRLVYTDGVVQAKYHNNADNFKPGYVTPDDRWDNYWRSGPNAILEWDQNLTGSGNGAKSMGQELAASDAFARCQSIKVFRNVCFGEPDQEGLVALKGAFEFDYNMKDVFAEAAKQCLGD
jgi:hypothetical protein